MDRELTRIVTEKDLRDWRPVDMEYGNQRLPIRVPREYRIL